MGERPRGKGRGRSWRRWIRIVRSFVRSKCYFRHPKRLQHPDCSLQQTTYRHKRINRQRWSFSSSRFGTSPQSDLPGIQVYPFRSEESRKEAGGKWISEFYPHGFLGGLAHLNKRIYISFKAATKQSFGGSGTTLSGRPAAPNPASANAVKSEDTVQPDHWAALSGGAKLSSGRGERIGGGVAAPIEIMDEDEDEDSDASGFDGFPEDDDAIVIDSD